MTDPRLALWLALGLLAMSAQGPASDLEARVTTLEARVTTLEKLHTPPEGERSSDAAASIVSVRLIRKEAQRENPHLDFYNIGFDVEFTGSQLLGDRRVRDIKGSLYFDDVFGDEIIGAPVTLRLGIGAGQKKVVERLMIDWTTVRSSKKWQRVLTTATDEMRMRFVADRVIYEGDGTQ